MAGGAEPVSGSSVGLVVGVVLGLLLLLVIVVLIFILRRRSHETSSKAADTYEISVEYDTEPTNHLEPDGRASDGSLSDHAAPLWSGEEFPGEIEEGGSPL
jgi:hypothetical protein